MFIFSHCLGSLGVNLEKLKTYLLGFLGLDLGNRSIEGVGTLKVDESWWDRTSDKKLPFFWSLEIIFPNFLFLA